MKRLFVVTYLLTISLFCVEVDVALGSYYAKANGVVIYQTDFFKGTKANIDNGYQPHLYIRADIDSQIKYMPLLHLNFTRIRSYGTSSVEIKTANGILDEILEAINFDEGVFNSTLTYNIYDVFLHYKVLDDRGYLPKVHLGAGIKQLNYNYDADVYSGVQFNDHGGSTIPMLYANIRKSLYSSISADFDTKYYIFGDSDIYDVAIKLDTIHQLNDKISIGAELGYKDVYSKIKGDDIENIGGTMHYSGFFFALISHFK